jgi:hypothetical protein
MWDESNNLENQLREACHHLLWVWYQFGSNNGDVSKKEVKLDCHSMSAPEGAGDFLASLGYIEWGSWSHTITEKGYDLMNEEF